MAMCMSRAFMKTVCVSVDNYFVRVLDVGPDKQRHLVVEATVV